MASLPIATFFCIRKTSLSNAIMSKAVTNRSQMTSRNNIKPEDRVTASAEWTQLFYSVLTMVHGLNVILVSV